MKPNRHKKINLKYGLDFNKTPLLKAGHSLLQPPAKGGGKEQQPSRLPLKWHEEERETEITAADVP